MSENPLINKLVSEGDLESFDCGICGSHGRINEETQDEEECDHCNGHGFLYRLPSKEEQEDE